MRLASTRSRYFSRWRRHTLPSPPLLPLPALGRACRVRGAARHRARTNCWGGGWRRWRGGGKRHPAGKRKEAQNTNQRYMYPRNEPSFVSGSLGQNTQGVEGVSSRMRNGRTAFAVGRRVSGRVPWPRNPLRAVWCVLTGTNVSAPLSAVPEVSRLEICERRLGVQGPKSPSTRARDGEDGGMAHGAFSLSDHRVSAAPHCQLVRSEMDSGGLLFSPRGHPQCASPILPGRMKRRGEVWTPRGGV